MAPSRTSSKRKVDDTDESVTEEQPSQASQSSKKARTEHGSQGQSQNPQFTNKVLPVHINLPAKQSGTTRIASWNVSGLAAAEKKGFKSYVEAEDPDILILTETKLNKSPDDPSLKTRFPHQYWSCAAKKGYAGTAVLSKQKPLSVDKTIPSHPDPDAVKGRIVTLEYETCYVVGTYVVNAGQGLKTMEEKKVWNTHFFAYLHELDKKKPVIWAGDLNVAPTALDLANPKPNWNKTAGYTEAETTAFKHFLEGSSDDKGKFVDMWRKLHTDERAYTYFSYRFNCRTKGIGWRIDGFVLSERFEERVKLCDIRGEIYGASDHIPVVLEAKGQL
ncbi:Endonuclease/exonuclease/phosphatase [Gymnopilus junonius]|uniref:Endonuclease/exonuclease/phosphatase n=1 Tax=Gymnopilus junonius TaxID=109634 RepID=A0A9P5NZW5_GYMJU|nr:Endonuclease/exonuclease/phosphatase [Gymnopilus junonius]